MGAFGLFSIEAYRSEPGLEVSAVADMRRDLAEGTGRAIGATAYADWRDLVHDPAVDVVHVVTPPNTHAEICVAAAGSGKSAFCEKPLALSLDEAERMIEAFSASQTMLGINYVMRHHPIYRLLINLSDEGLLGQVRRVSLDSGAQSVPDNHWFWDRSISGGILVEHGVHFFDVFRRIVGEAQARWTVDQEKRILAEVEYLEGGWGTFYHDFSIDLRAEGLQATLVFETGTAQLLGWIPEHLAIRALTNGRAATWKTIAEEYSGCQITLEDTDEVATIEYDLPDRQNEYMKATVRGMIQVARAHRDPGSVPEVTPVDALESLRLALSAQSIAHPPSAHAPIRSDAG
jgi:predicted dehydrogenase